MKEFEFPDQEYSQNAIITGTKNWISIGEAFKNIPDPDTDNDLKNHTYSKFKLNLMGI